MVARGPGGVNRGPARSAAGGRWLARTLLLSLLGWAGAPGDAGAKRVTEPLEYTESGVVEVEEGASELRAVRFVLGPEEEAACVEDLVNGHLGLGTAADVFLDGPAGVQVNLLSGNLIWRHTYLPHGMPATHLALPLTYNAQADPDLEEVRLNGVPDRWRSGGQVHLRAGVFGVMEIVEDDGFVHAFYAMREGEVPGREELIDEIVERRRSGVVPAGEAIPRGARFRRQMESDDAFLGAMRIRFLGEGVGVAGAYVSEARGHQRLEVEDDGSATRTFPDGTVDHFDASGWLTSRMPLVGPPVAVERQRTGIAALRIERGPTLTLERDGGGRLEGAVGGEARRIQVIQQGGRLVEIRATDGDWLFEYDERDGALVAIHGPRDWVRIQYDGVDRRVVSLSGPAGQTTLAYSASPGELGARVSGPQGTAEVTFDTTTMERVVRDDRGEAVVVFDGGANRPVAIGDLLLGYDTAGHVVRVEGPGGTLEVTTDEADRPTAIRTSAGDAIELTMAETGLLESARDGDGVGVRFVYDTLRRLSREEGTRGDIRLGRNLWGELEKVTLRGGDTTRLERDAAGRLTRVAAPTGAELHLRWDAGDRLQSARGAGDHDVTIDRASDGSMRAVDSDGNVLTFSMADARRVGRLERSTPTLRADLSGDAAGTVLGLSSDDGLALRARHEGGSLVRLEGGATGDLRLTHDGIGLASIGDGADQWSLDRDRETGRTNRVRGAGGLDLRLGHDSAGHLTSLSRGGRADYRVTRATSGRPPAVDAASGRLVSLRRDPAGRVNEVLDGERSVLRTRRDDRGRVTAAATGKGDPWWLAVAGAGWPSRMGSPDGSTWNLFADGEGRVITAKWPDETIADFEWTAAGALGAARWPAGAWYMLYGSDGRLARTEALLGGLVEYECFVGGLGVWRGGSLSRILELGPHGRYQRATDGGSSATVDEATRSPAGALAGWRRVGASLEVTHDTHGRPVELRDEGPDALTLTLSHGADGLLGGWTLGPLTGDIDRDALGRRSSGSTPVLPSSSPLSPLFRPSTHAAPAGTLAQALLHPYLTPPWSRGGGIAPWPGAGTGASLGPPLPAWAIDRLWLDADTGWTAALPEPPHAAVSVPDPRAADRVTVPGALALLGFLPEDLSEHRVLASLPAPAVTVALPGADELRALRELTRTGAVGLTLVSVEAEGRGLVLHPEPPPVGHPTPWAAMDDPLALRHPASEILGVPTIPPAPGAAHTRARRFGDTDPLAERLRHALDRARWWSPIPEPLLGRRVAGARPVAGALSPWTPSRVQVVVDTRGRVRGLDLGASAIQVWNRQVIEAFYGGALEGRASADLSRFAPVWLPFPGAPPTVSLGLYPGAGRLWPDRTGTLRVSW